MSLSMFLEIECGASLDGVRYVLSGLEESFDCEPNRIFGTFRESNCYFVFEECAGPQDLVAEGLSVEWQVGVRAGFHYRADNLLSSWGDMVKFISSYAGLQPFRFVLSFQYEELYAVRDETGLRIIDRRVL